MRLCDLSNSDYTRLQYLITSLCCHPHLHQHCFAENKKPPFEGHFKSIVLVFEEAFDRFEPVFRCDLTFQSKKETLRTIASDLLKQNKGTPEYVSGQLLGKILSVYGWDKVL